MRQIAVPIIVETRSESIAQRGAPISWPRGERGATFVEASVALPAFLMILLSAFYLLHYSFQLQAFQYQVAETMRETFTLNSSARGNRGWERFFEQKLRERSTGTFPAFTIESVNFSPCTAASGWGCAVSATPGTMVSLNVKADKDFGLSFLTKVIGFKTKAVAVVQMRQTE
jgi:hypothetical protein